MTFPVGELQKLCAYLTTADLRGDHLVFRIHCTLTMVVLLACSILLTTSQIVGTPIQCFGAEMQKPIDTFCWVTTTFAMPEGFGKKVGSEVAHPGVENEHTSKGPKRFYSYYQWVCFVVFFQALMCYIPKAIWNYSEGGLLSQLMADFNGICPSQKDKQKLIQYILKYRSMHKRYAFTYWGCECLCLLNVVTQMWMMDSFLGGFFFKYGISIMRHIQAPLGERVDPMIFLFPRVTKCTFYKYGPSGTIETRDSLCVLSPNVFNEKLYIYLWFWYICLAAMLGFVVMSRDFVTELGNRMEMKKFPINESQVHTGAEETVSLIEIKHTLKYNHKIK